MVDSIHSMIGILSRDNRGLMGYDIPTGNQTWQLEILYIKSYKWRWYWENRLQLQLRDFPLSTAMFDFQWVYETITNKEYHTGSSDLFPVASFCTVSHCNFKKTLCVFHGGLHFASSTSFNRCIDPPSTSKKRMYIICFDLCKLKFPWLQKYPKVASKDHKICISINIGLIWPNRHLRQENALACFNTTWPELEVHQDSQVHLLGKSWQMGRSHRSNPFLQEPWLAIGSVCWEIIGWQNWHFFHGFDYQWLPEGTIHNMMLVMELTTWKPRVELTRKGMGDTVPPMDIAILGSLTPSHCRAPVLRLNLPS